MRFGKLEIDPARNPAVLDTATWAPMEAWWAVASLSDACWQSMCEAAAQGNPLPDAPGFHPCPASVAVCGGRLYFLACLADGQSVFVELGPRDGASPLGTPLGARSVSSIGRVAAYRADAANVDRYLRQVNPAKGPRPLGAIPRLGIGSRMTTAIWPAVWRAIARSGFAANAIQNSLRELNLLEDLLAGRPAERNYAFSFGTIEAGYTGSSFEGLWLSGTLAALMEDSFPLFGADADHIQVKRGPDGLDRARRVVRAARYYSFFTLDVSDILDYGALARSPVEAADSLSVHIPQAGERRAVLAYHRQKRRLAGEYHAPDETAIARLVGKYWTALAAVQELYEHVAQLKAGQPFDLELSIDEHPPEVATVDCLTTDEELAFVLLELERRRIPITHVAPNLGIEKGTDYRCPDGLSGLEGRTRRQTAVAESLGVMLDVHSGDDLGVATRQAIHRATQGRCHFKVSPSLQLLFAEVLQEHDPELFGRWWEYARAYAQREAAAGSPLAAECLHEYEISDNLAPSARHSLFHHYSFGFVGERDAGGQFLRRHEFYDLPAAFYRAYQDRLVEFLCTLAEDVLGA